MKLSGGRKALVAFALAFFLLPALAHSQSAPPLAAWLEKAQSLKLAEDPYWRSLCHYREENGGIKSLIDDPDFFCSPQGDKNPEAELEALLRLLFTPSPEPGQSAFCRWPARSEWLASALSIPTADLPISSCPEVEETLAKVAADRASLVFAASNMGNPASLFGHTLLVIESDAGTRLTANAVNYSAITPPEFGPLYIVKGIFGFYPGRFGVGPYYAKLSEYSDLGLRDMWEYPLALSPAEIRRMLLALLEMAPYYSDYFFADENCSFALLYLLDAARPGLDLAARADLFVLPAQTLRLADQAGLLSGPPVFIPSRSARIKALAQSMPPAQVNTALAVSRGNLPPDAVLASAAPEPIRARQLDLAAQLLSLDHADKKIDQPTYAARFRNILAARSHLPADENEPRPETPAQPLDGHLPALFAGAAGSRDGEPFLAARLRLLYHGLSDCDTGYRPGAQIIFGDAELRYYPGEQSFELQNLTAFDITSLAPRSRLFRPASFRIHIGLSRVPVRKEGDTIAGDLSYGRGLSYQIPGLGLCYAIVSADLGISGALDQSYDLGPALRAGILRELGSLGKIRLNITAVHYALGERHDRVKYSAAGSFFTGKNSALFWEISDEKAFGRSITEASFSAGGYF